MRRFNFGHFQLKSININRSNLATSLKPLQLSPLKLHREAHFDDFLSLFNLSLSLRLSFYYCIYMLLYSNIFTFSKHGREYGHR